MTDVSRVLVEIIVPPAPHDVVLGIPGPPGPPGRMPHVDRFPVVAHQQARFSLLAVPLGGVVMLTKNGLWQMDVAVDGSDVLIDPPAEDEDEVMVLYWT